MHKTVTLILLCNLFFFSCKKEKTTWDTDWSAPIAYGTLTINDMIPVENTITNSEGFLSLVIHEPVFGLSLDTLIKLPDTTIIQKSAIGVPTVNVTPSFSLPDNYNQSYELNEIQLKRVIIKSGTAEITISSPWPGKSKITLSFNSIQEAGMILERMYNLEAGSIASPAQAYELIDMSGYDMDLKGLDGDLYNTIFGDILMESNEVSSTYTVSSSDSVSFGFKFKDLVPYYAKGYFGQYAFTDTLGLALTPLKKIVRGSILLDSIDLNLSILNGFNLIAQGEITKLIGFNSRTGNQVALSFPKLGTILNINPATGGLYDNAPSSYPIEINNSNSNIIDFIENLSDSIEIGYQMAINPFGNVSGGDDEYFPDSKLELYLDGEFPLNFGANDLTIADTFQINYKNESGIYPENGLVILSYSNGFPLSADAVFYLIDESNVVLDSIQGSSPINTGTYNAESFVTTPLEGSVNFNLTDSQIDNLEKTKEIVLYVSFTSADGNKVRIRATDFFKFDIRTNLQISINL